MNKADFISKVAEIADLTTADAQKAVNAMTSAIADELSRGGSVALVGFGTFQVKERAARTGRNPATGATMEIAASKVPRFSAGKALKEAVNG